MEVKRNLGNLSILENPPEEMTLTGEILSQSQPAEQGGVIPFNQGRLLRIPDLENKIWFIPIELIDENKDQPRTYFNEETMQELQALMEESGQETPIKVSAYRTKDGQVRFLIVDGNRRTRVLTQMGLPHIKSEVAFKKTFRELYSASAGINFGHDPHNPIEEARAYRKMIEWTKEEDGTNEKTAIEQVAAKLGLKKQRIKDRLKLLALSEIIQETIIRTGTKASEAMDILDLTTRASKGGKPVNQSRIAEILLRNPDTDYDAEFAELRASGEVPTSRREVKRALHAVLASEEGILSPELAKQLETQQAILGLVQALSLVKLRLSRVIKQLDSDPEQVRSMFKNRRGCPPEVMESRLIEIAEMTKVLHEKGLKPAMMPPNLEIPKGKESFIKSIEKLETPSPQRKTMAKHLAQASDNEGETLTANKLARLVQQDHKNEQITSLHIASNLKPLEKELQRIGLEIGTHNKRIRSKETNELTIVPGYRLEWIKKQ